MKNKIWIGGFLCALFGAVGATVLGVSVKKTTCYSFWAMIILSGLFLAGIVFMALTLCLCAKWAKEEELRKLFYAKIMQSATEKSLTVTHTITSKNDQVKRKEMIEYKKQ